jgi:hypothetical protein
MEMTVSVVPVAMNTLKSTQGNMGIVTLLALIGSVITAVVLVAGAHSIQQDQQAGTSACVSQGGTVPGC